MKKLLVSNQCVACGICTVDSDLFIELANGKVAPAGTGYFAVSQNIDIYRQITPFCIKIIVWKSYIGCLKPLKF